MFMYFQGDKMAAIGELLPEQQKRKLLLNGTEIPRKVLSNHWDEFIDQIVFIDHYEFEGVDVPYEQKLGRLLSFEADGRVIFEKKDHRQFTVHIDDIKDIRKFVPVNKYKREE